MSAKQAWEPGALRALVVDDEPDVLLGLKMLAESTKADVRAAASGEEARDIALAWKPHLVISDVTMGGMSGMDLLDALRKMQPAPRVILVTGFGTIELAVTAMGKGASHFVTKPFDNEELLTSIRRFGREALIEERARTLRADRAGGRTPVLAESPAMRDVMARVEQVAPTAVTVLIRGGSGVGKELVARAIHERSAGRDKPFLAVNTAALPDSLLESELFGHRRGAFTGADRNRKGIFEEAKGGTVFLDEIGLMSPSFQGKLLRVLQERTVVPLGTTEPVPVDFRLIAATSQSLRDRIAAGEFREDLLYRLQVVTVDVPPLRGRSDIAPLAAYFLSRYAPLVAGDPTFSDRALQELEAHAWPGNVRELENCVQRAVVLCDGGVIEPAHLGLDDDEPWRHMSAEAGEVTYEEAKQRAVQEFQRRFVERALSEAAGNVSQAARLCGLTRAALQRIMRSLGLERARYV
ncbi:MAG: sigma-54-dependent transcriptional regulator [Planctomycetota bacterium]|jgi:DNA-binding NtrC family response regulator